MNQNCSESMLIPLNPDLNGLPSRHKNFQHSVFKERREQALAEMRMASGLPYLIKELRPDKVYRLVVPSGEILQKGKDGLFRGVFYDQKGRIAKHARFERLPMNFSKIAKAVGAQILLVSIAMQLNRIESAISAISEELHDDRIAKIRSGIRQYENAMLMSSNAHRDHVIYNAIQSLIEGLEGTQLELKRRIANLPEPTNSFWDNWGRSKSRGAAESLRLAEESLMISIQGVSALSQCYAALEESHVGIEALSSSLQALEQCGIKVACEKARIVEVKSFGVLPEQPWIQFIKSHNDFKQKMSQKLADNTHNNQDQIVLEFKKSELEEEA